MSVTNLDQFTNAAAFAKQVGDAGRSTSVAVEWNAVTPSDSAVIAPGVIGVFASGAGNIAAKDWKGNSITIPITAGAILNISPRQIMATGTTATGIQVLR